MTKPKSKMTHREQRKKILEDEIDVLLMDFIDPSSKIDLEHMRNRIIDLALKKLDEHSLIPIDLITDDYFFELLKSRFLGNDKLFGYVAKEISEICKKFGKTMMSEKEVAEIISCNIKVMLSGSHVNVTPFPIIQPNSIIKTANINEFV